MRIFTGKGLTFFRNLGDLNKISALLKFIRVHIKFALICVICGQKMNTNAEGFINDNCKIWLPC